MDYLPQLESSPSPDDVAVLSEGIHQFTKFATGESGFTSLTFFVRDEQGRIVGGVHGNYNGFGWLYVSALWVAEDRRGSGMGSQLLSCIEAEAIRRRCVNCYLETLDFQAPEFYKKNGYQEFAKIDDFHAGHARVFLRKCLA